MLPERPRAARSAWRWPVALAVACMLVGRAGPAAAVVLEEDELAGTSTELGLIARAFHYVLFGPALEPPAFPVDENPALSAALDLRGYFAHKREHYRVILHGGATTSLSSVSGLGGLAQNAASLGSPRWLPLELELGDEATSSLLLHVDWAYLDMTFGRFTATVGRQPVTFGRGRVQRPMDLAGTFSISAIDTEYKPGVDAARLDYNPDAKTSVAAVVVVGEGAASAREHDFVIDEGGTAALLRGRRTVGTHELGGLAGWVRGDLIVGLDALIDAKHVEFYGEATLTRIGAGDTGDGERADGDDVARAAVGVSWKRDKLLLLSEWFYEGFGADDSTGYAAAALSRRAAVGELVVLGRYYGAAFANYELHPLVRLAGGGIVNLLDPSAFLTFAVAVSLSDNVSGSLGAFVPVGERATLSALPPATPSEFGLFPYAAYATLSATM